MNKKQITALATCVATVAIAVVGGTLAYFTDTDSADNVFVTGNVKIEQNEYQRNESTKAIENFVDGKKLMPAVHSKLTPKESVSVDGSSFSIRKLEGNYVDKIVNVKNTGTEDCYVRTIIAIPNISTYDDGSPADNPLHWNYLDATDFNGTGWNWSGMKDGDATEQTDKISNVTIGSVSYDVYVATYNTTLSANAITSPSMVGLYLDESVDSDSNGYYYVVENEKIELGNYLKSSMNILVASQACQTTGFADAWEALDTCFGDITATNLPWGSDYTLETVAPATPATPGAAD